MSARRLCVGVVAGAHGIRGGVRIKSFTATPSDVGAYGPVSDEAASRAFAIHITGEQKDVVLARLDGVTTREAAEALKGMLLYVERDRLPPAEEDEFYHVDLIGLDAALADGTVFGKVSALWNFGGGDSIEIALPDGTTIMFPFTRAAVPEIDLAAGRLVVQPPVELSSGRSSGASS